MQMNQKHTHRGTCQACGRSQAMQLRNDKLAKHGYTVDWGFFNGVCMGAEAAPLEVDKTMTESVIRLLGFNAGRADKRADDLRAGTVEPKWFRRGNWVRGRQEQIACTRAELSDYEAKQQIDVAAHEAEYEARSARRHAEFLKKLIAERHGQPLIAVKREAKKELVVGSKVQRSGNVYTVIELRDQVASGCGPHLNGQLLKHAILQRTDGRTIAAPVRTIRQSAILEGGAQ